MNRTVYLDGAYISPDQAKISIFDRSVLFGDAVYEVAGVLNGKLLSFDNHMNRLERSLKELSIPQPLTRDEILEAFRQLVKRNNLYEGLVYMQVSRGQAERDFSYQENMTPTVFMFTQEKPSSDNEKANTGVALRSAPDIRWARRDIKSVNLLGQVLAKQTASQGGAYEALLVDPTGVVTECGSTSFFIFKDNTIITRPLSNDILPGITRHSIITLCETNQIALEERPFTLDEAYGAQEAFISGASTYVLPVVKIDDVNIGDGIPGPATAALRKIYISYARETAI